MHPQVVKTIEAFEAAVSGRDVTGVGAGNVLYRLRDLGGDAYDLKEHTEKSVIGFTFIGKDNERSPGACHKIDVEVPGYVGELHLVRAVYEFAEAHGYRHCVTEEFLRDFVRLPDLFELLREQTS